VANNYGHPLERNCRKLEVPVGEDGFPAEIYINGFITIVKAEFYSNKCVFKIPATDEKRW